MQGLTGRQARAITYQPLGFDKWVSSWFSSLFCKKTQQLMNIALFRGSKKSLGKTFRVLGRSRYFRSKYSNPPCHHHKCSVQGSRSTECAAAAVPRRRHRLGARQERFLHSRRTLRPIRCPTSIRRRANLWTADSKGMQVVQGHVVRGRDVQGWKVRPFLRLSHPCGSEVVHPAAPVLNWDHVCYASDFR